MKKFLLVCLFFVVSLSLSAQVKLLTLKELDKRIAKGNDTTYVINFWATWCAPCIEELPHFEKLNTEYKNKPVKVILLSFDSKSKLQSRVIPFVKNQKLEAE
ncbi:MAG: redoxin domain-containing protein, partial [Pedobacter sp.]